MLSAGYSPMGPAGYPPQAPVAPYPQPSPFAQPAMAPSMPSPTFQNMAPPASPLGGLSISAKMNPADLPKILEQSQNGYVQGLWASTIVNLSNSIGAAVIGAEQMDVMRKYYNAQMHIADVRADVAKEQLKLQGKGMDTMQSMHEKQIDHEKSLAEIEATMRARIAMISEDGKTERAKVVASRDYFNVRGWDPRESYSLGGVLG